MTGTLLRINWLNLKRDRVALGLTFILPLVFFSIFAFIFGGGGGGGGLGTMKLVVVDLDGSEISRKLAAALEDQGALTVETAPPATEEEPDPAPYDRETGRLAVRTGKRSAAVVIPPGFGEAFGKFGTDQAPVELIHDPSNPFARHIVTGLLQACAMTAAPDALLQGGIDQLETFGGELTPRQKASVEMIKGFLARPEPVETGETGDDGQAAAGAGDAFGGLINVEAVSAMEGEGEEEEDGPSIISYYAAGIGVMFLLFSMAGAGGSLLENQEQGTLERLLSSNVGMGRLLTCNWFFFAVVGFLQLLVMFVFAALVFGLDLFTPRHLTGFVLMTAVTAAAAAAFGIALATVCRSRAQLGALSTILILVMSALGGSMVPRFIMPDFMETTSLFTFNGWALDGYLKVFWYDDPQATFGGFLVSLLPQLAVLAAMAVVLFLVARTLARRWESA